MRMCACDDVCVCICKCVCVWKALNQRASAGGQEPMIVCPGQRGPDSLGWKRACKFLISDMARWLSHKPPLPTWHGNITLNDFISSHFILSLWGISKCVFHAPGSLIKCRGSLVVRPPRKPDYSQHFPDIMLPEADSAQASRRCLSEFSSGSRVFQTSPDYMFRIRQYTDFFIPRFQRAIHDSCSPSKAQSSAERNSTMPLPAFFVSRWLLAEQPEIVMQWFAFWSAFFSGNCTERRETSFGFCWSMQNAILHWWHPRPMYTDICALRSMSQPSTEGNSTMPLPALFVGRWLLAEQPETLMQWFAVSGLFRGTCAARRETSLGFMLEQATQRHRHLSTMFHVTTQHSGKQHATLRTIFLVRKIVPKRLGVCGKPWIKGHQQGARNPWLSVLANEDRTAWGENVPANFWFRIWPGG